MGLNIEEQGQLKVREQDDWIWNRRRERYQPMVQGVFNGSKGDDKVGTARSLRVAPKLDRNWRPSSTVFVGGSVDAPGEKVSRVS